MSQFEISFFDFYIVIFINLIILCRDIEENPGPKTKPSDNLSICPWNVNNIPSMIFRRLGLNESLLCEVTIRSKKFIIGTVYRSPTQNFDGFESLLSNSEFLLQDISNRNPYLTLLLCDYNARNTKWSHHDITTTGGIQLETTTTI